MRAWPALAEETDAYQPLPKVSLKSPFTGDKAKGEEMDVYGVVAALGGVGGIATFLMWLFRGTKWGINLEKVNCPECKRLMPTVRTPKDEYERQWGGWTCPACGTKMDKWGNKRT
jgi:hypothetical protein